MAERPAPQSFKLTAGENAQLEFTVTDNDSAAVNLTGGSGRFAAARDVGSSLVIDSGASPQTAFIVESDYTAGLVNVTIDDTVLDGLSGTYLYEFKWVDSSGSEAVVAWGYITIVTSLLSSS